jgi:hypothetical protein
MLADEALWDDSGDKLNFKPFADALAGIIDSPNTSTPLVMAINARWGAGKTTLGRMIQRRLESKSAADGHAPHVTCWFAAWMHDEASVLSTSLAAEVAQAASRRRPLWRQLLNPLSPGLSSVDDRKRRTRQALFYVLVVIVFLTIMITIAIHRGYIVGPVSQFYPDALKKLNSLQGATYAAIIATLILLGVKMGKFLLPVAKAIADFTKDPQSAAMTGSMKEVRHELGKLIKHATPKGSKFVIFIDDLDRCKPPRSVDVLEATNQLLDHPGVVVVVLSDMQFVAKSVEIKYAAFASVESSAEVTSGQSGHSTYGWNFLQKIVQLQFDLPRYPVKLIRDLVSELAAVPGQFKPTALWRRTLRAKLDTFKSRLSSPAVIAIVANVVVLAVATAGAFVLLVLVRMLRVPLPMARLLSSLPGFMLFLIVSGGITQMVLWAVGRLRQTRLRKKIDEQIRTRIASGERDFSRVAVYVKDQNSAAGKDESIEGIVRERLQRYLEDESEIQREAEDEVMRYLEPMPRHAKRLLNRLRLLLFVAHERRMFGGEPKLTARHIGKWAVLGERWPELLNVLREQPQFMESFEDNSNTFEYIVNKCVPVYKNDDELQRFCLYGEGVKLGSVISRIVELTPASLAKSPAITGK